jgi:predicted NUDIX family NTP pyrophosphohydrolase
MAKSAGLLLYRTCNGPLEVLLAHPGGPFWTRKDEGAWTIPKGAIDEGEDPLDAAKREFTEETGVVASGAFVALEPVRQPGGKLIYAWAVEGDCDAGAIVSNLFSMEWPPRSGQMKEFPEIDRAGWFTLGEARVKLLRGQLPFLDQLENSVPLRNAPPGAPSR